MCTSVQLQVQTFRKFDHLSVKMLTNVRSILLESITYAEIRQQVGRFLSNVRQLWTSCSDVIFCHRCSICLDFLKQFVLKYTTSIICYIVYIILKFSIISVCLFSRNPFFAACKRLLVQRELTLCFHC